MVEVTDVTIRLKHGIHTIFLFIDSLKPFSEITASLVEVLRERYPDGELTTSEGITQIPLDDPHFAYARMKNQHDSTQGWEQLDVTETDIPTRKGIKNNMTLAFALLPEDGSDPKFVVDWPTYDDEPPE